MPFEAPAPRLLSVDDADMRLPVQREQGITLRRQGVLLVLCFFWFLPGIAGEGLWKPIESVLVPVAQESFAGGWTPAPTLLGEPWVEVSSLYLYLSYLSGEALSGWLPQQAGMRLSNLLWLAIGLGVAGSFVGATHGSRVGWRYVLLVLTSLGLMLNSKTVNPDVALLALGAAGVVSTRMMREISRKGGLLMGLAAALGFWCVGVLALWYLLALLVAPWLFAGLGLRGGVRSGSYLSVPIAVFAVALWANATTGVNPGLMAAYLDQSLSHFEPRALLTSLWEVPIAALWVTWPALPFAILAYRRFRHRPFAYGNVPDGLHALLAGLLALVLAGHTADSGAILILPAAAYMAVVEMKALSREVAKMHDWFAILVIGGGMIGFFWVVWVASHTGTPASLAAWLAQNGIDAGASGLAPVLALLSSLVWLMVMLRIGRSPERAVINWVVGVTMAWLVFSFLLFDSVGRATGYVGLAGEVAAALPDEPGCVEIAGSITPGLAAQVGYQSGLGFERSGHGCDWALARLDDGVAGEVMWQGKRAKDAMDQALVLYKVR